MEQQHLIRHEADGDRDAVRRLLTHCFETPAEADLVERLRADGDVALALVAEDAGSIVGYAAFSRLYAPFVAVGLAPVAVSADHRRRGIAAAMIHSGLTELRSRGVEAVFVVGDPNYYNRFGFDARAASWLDTPFPGPYFMVATLTGAPLRATTGAIAYPAAFDDLA